MLNLKLRIGTKLAIAAGLGVVLVAGMIVNEHVSSAAVEQSDLNADKQQVVHQDAQAADLAVKGTQSAIRDMRLASSLDEVTRAEEPLRAQFAGLRKALEAGAQHASRPENRARFSKALALVQEYEAAVSEMTAKRKDMYRAWASQIDAVAKWNKEFDTLLVSPAVAGLANHVEVDAILRDARLSFNNARIAFWHYSAGGDEKLLEQASLLLGKLSEQLKHGREVAGDKTVAESVDRVLAASSQFKEAVDASAKNATGAVRINSDRMLPLRTQVDGLLAEIASLTQKLAEEAKAEVVTEMTSAGRIGLGVGLLVVLVLIGSAVFSMLTIAKPIRRIGEVLLELANGNKTVEVPYAERGDEVGDNARAAKTFKDNLLRIEKMEAEQNEAEVRAVAQRKADMHQLANQFQAAVGQIVDTVSSTSTELEAAAGTLTRTAETTQQLSTTVAAASEEASANVQSVASASEQLASSVSEIARQVHESSKISGEAVKQAEKTDARIAELSQAATRIGDVVKLISSVAEQTNLLALNATIEAARAGEAGRGFAVVASEVKALAAQTAKATEEIGTQIAGMQTATHDSVAAIKEIGGTIGRISEIAAAIAAAVEEQGAATQEISRNVQQAAQGTAQVASSITDVNRGAGETGAASSQVLTSARSLSSESNHLKVEVDKFLHTVRAA